MSDDFKIKKLAEQMEQGDIQNTRQTIDDEDEMQLLGRMNLLISHLKDLNDLIIKTNDLSDNAVKNSTNALSKSLESLQQSLQALTQSQQAVETSIKAEENSSTAKSQSDTALSNSESALSKSESALTKSQQAVDRTDAYEKENTEQNGRLTAIETDEQSHVEKMNTLEKAITDEAQTRSQQDASIRDEINRLSSSESTLNEEILQRLDGIEKDKLDTTQANIKFGQIDTDIKNINSEQATQNSRLNTLEGNSQEQRNKIIGLEGDVEDINTTLGTMNTTIIDNHEQFTLFKDEQLLKNNDIDEEQQLIQTALSETQKQVNNLSLVAKQLYCHHIYFKTTTYSSNGNIVTIWCQIYNYSSEPFTFENFLNYIIANFNHSDETKVLPVTGIISGGNSGVIMTLFTIDTSNKKLGVTIYKSSHNISESNYIYSESSKNLEKFIDNVFIVGD